MKSVLVSRPANVEFCESQSGTETMPAALTSVIVSTLFGVLRDSAPAMPLGHTILDKDVEALPYQQVVVEHDQAERQRKDVVARPDLEELADPSLRHNCQPLQISPTLTSQAAFGLLRARASTAQLPRIIIRQRSLASAHQQLHRRRGMSRAVGNMREEREAPEETHQALHLLPVEGRHERLPRHCVTGLFGPKVRGRLHERQLLARSRDRGGGRGLGRNDVALVRDVGRRS